LGPRTTSFYDDSLLTQIAKLRRGITSQFTLKLEKTQKSTTRALVSAVQWSLVVKDLSVTLFLKYVNLSKQIYSVFDANLSSVVSN